VLGDDDKKCKNPDEDAMTTPVLQDLEFWVKLIRLVVCVIEEDGDIYTHHLNQ